MSNRHHFWLSWAINDFETAELVARDGRHNWACYLAGQAAEKALKAVLLALGEPAPRTHALAPLLYALQQAGVPAAELEPLQAGARFLTRAEQAARYPMDEVLPSDLFDANDAAQALDHARRYLDTARRLLADRSA